MDDLDLLLGRLGDAPVDPRVAGIAPAVMAGLAQRRESAMARRHLALAGALALGIGVLGATVPGTPARAETIGMSDYAPSRLLGG